MRICIIADASSDHILRLTRYLIENKHEVHLISWKIRPDLPLTVHLHKLRTIKFPLIRELAWLLQARRLVGKIDPEIVDGHYITVNGFIAAFSGFHPLVVTAWGSDLLINPRQNRLWKLTGKYALRHADKIVCLFPSDIVKDILIRLEADLSKVDTYYLGVDTTEFRYTRDHNLIKTELGISTSCPVIINTRGLAPIYGIDTFVSAIPIVLGQIPQTKFIVLHRKSEKSVVNSLEKQSCVAGNVKFIEWVPRSKMPLFLSAADVFVSPSLSDGASNALFEAMSCEAPIVATDIPANRYWIKDGENGFLFKPGDYNTLAEKIICLLRDKEKRVLFGGKCRKIIQENAEQKTQMANIQRIYQELVEKHYKKNE